MYIKKILLSKDQFQRVKTGNYFFRFLLFFAGIEIKKTNALDGKRYAIISHSGRILKLDTLSDNQSIPDIFGL